jgi:plasmid stabilization system protein ParE
MATRKPQVSLTASFERNLEEIAAFLAEADATAAYGVLLDELAETVIPNLERFPDMGRPFLSREVCSVEGINALERLENRLQGLAIAPAALREYMLRDYLVLYVMHGLQIHLLAIRNQRQLAFHLGGQGWKVK